LRNSRKGYIEYKRKKCDREKIAGENWVFFAEFEIPVDPYERDQSKQIPYPFSHSSSSKKFQERLIKSCDGRGLLNQN
jgi:hypothetical protein